MSGMLAMVFGGGRLRMSRIIYEYVTLSSLTEPIDPNGIESTKPVKPSRTKVTRQLKETPHLYIAFDTC